MNTAARTGATCGWPSARAAAGAVALACFAAGTVASMVIARAVVLLAAAEAYAAFRRAHYHPATLLGLVAVLSLMIETYNKGVAALPLVLVLLVAGSFIWYLAQVEPAADPVSGITSTVFMFVWVGASARRRPAARPEPVPRSPRHRLPPGGRHRDRGRRRRPRCWSARPWVVTRWRRPSALTRRWEGSSAAPWPPSWWRWSWSTSSTPGPSARPDLGVVVAVVAPLGDLSQSMIKRHLGLKDMGRLCRATGASSTGSTASLRPARHVLRGQGAAPRLSRCAPSA